MKMMMIAGTDQKIMFDQEELVTWHYKSENKQIPLPAVVVRQEADTVIIKTYLQGKFQMLNVDSDQLISR
jgi:hypothetical protein